MPTSQGHRIPSAAGPGPAAGLRSALPPASSSSSRCPGAAGRTPHEQSHRFPGAGTASPGPQLGCPSPRKPVPARVPAKVTGEAEGLGPAPPRPHLSPARGGQQDAAAEGRQEEFERRHLRAARLSGSGAGSGPGRAGAACAGAQGGEQERRDSGARGRREGEGLGPDVR